jgi:hypothetical protein
MGLADQLGAVDPQGVVTSLLADQAPDLVQNGNVDPQSVLNNLIRKGLDQRQQRQLQQQQQQPQNFDAFGKTKEEIDAQPPEDFSQFGQETPEEKPPQPTAGAFMTGVESAAEAPLKVVGGAMQHAALLPTPEADISQQAFMPPPISPDAEMGTPGAPEVNPLVPPA